MIPEYRTAFLRQALGDRYAFEGFLGKGAFASVFLVRNRRLGRLEALKVLAESYDGDHKFAHRFIDEAKLIASLNHPSIVQVHDYGELDGVLWYSMQYVEGPTLRQELMVRGRFASADVAKLAIPLLDALAYSHQQNIIHRDIKPGNVLIHKSGRPYLMDFGIAKVKGSSLHTQTGSVMGTPAYIAPEQAAGGPLDARGDLYSLGITLYELLAGFSPFTSSDPLRTLLRRLKEDPAPLRVSYPEIDEELERIVFRALMRRPEDRYATAEAMAEDLRGRFQDPKDRQPYKVRAVSQSVEKLGASSPDAGRDPVDLSEQNTVVTSMPELRLGGGEAGVDLNLPPGEVESLGDPGVQEHEDPAKEAQESQGHRRFVWAGFALLLAACLAVGLWWGLGASDAQSPAVPAKTHAAEAPVSPAPSNEGVSNQVANEIGPKQEPEAGTSDEKPGPSDSSSEEIAGRSEIEAPDSTSIDDRESTRGPEISIPAKESSPAPGSSSRKTQPPPLDPSGATAFRRPVTIPKIRVKVEPILPASEAQACLGERVLLTVLVGENGVVESVSIHESSRASCAEAASKAARAYEFVPATDFEGKPVEASTTLSIGFDSVRLEIEDP